MAAEVSLSDVAAFAALAVSLVHLVYRTWRDWPRPLVIARWPHHSSDDLLLVLENQGANTAYDVDLRVVPDPAPFSPALAWDVMLPVSRMDPGVTYGVAIVFEWAGPVRYDLEVSWRTRRGGRRRSIICPVSTMRDQPSAAPDGPGPDQP